VVGVDIRPGTYRAEPDQTAAPCDWERASGFTHAIDETTDMGSGRGGTTVAVVEGERFSTHACTWTLSSS
jgi:hypothetical protein